MKGKFLFKKILSCVLIVLACASLCVSWIKVPDSKYARETKKALEAFEDEVDKLSDECEELQDLLDKEDIDISIVSFGNSIEDFYSIMADLELSPLELAKVLPIVMQINSLFDEMEKYEEIEELYEFDDVKNMLEVLAQVQIVFMVIAGIFAFTVCIDLVYLLLHVFNRKAAGGISITLHIIWTVIVTAGVVLVNFAAMEEVSFEVIAITPAPYVGVVMLIASAIIWKSAKKDLAAIGTLEKNSQSIPVQTPVNPAYAMPAAEPVAASPQAMDNSAVEMPEADPFSIKPETKVCNMCGGECVSGASFCKYCGNKLEEV